jgi:predicted polyphosphate/ATP-dependent NAD kinase
MSAENNVSARLKKRPSPKRVGFIVNPIAGMGGAVGLKGTDGKHVLSEAIALGAKPLAPSRAEAFLSELRRIGTPVRLVVGAGIMGEYEAKSCGFEHTFFGERNGETTAEDTKKTVKMMTKEGVDILVFCGGDGTARDVQNVVGMRFPVLGVPTGVKMHSAIFAVNPTAAARVTARFLLGELPLKEAEVMDIDEKAFREGQVSAEIYGYVLTPFEPYLIQGNKMASPMTESELRNQAAIALYVIEEMKPDVIYVIGPGTTTRTIADLLDAKKTLLGVDLFINKALVASDVNEKRILEAICGNKTKIIVTPIGGQGFVFGRGNQQISSKIIRQVGLGNVIVIATEGKLKSLPSLRVDTGNSELDATIRRNGFKVVTDYKIERALKVE